MIVECSTVSATGAHSCTRVRTLTKHAIQQGSFYSANSLTSRNVCKCKARDATGTKYIESFKQ